MEIIKRQIGLEQAKNRYFNHLPYYSGGTKYENDYVWGGYCSDIGIPKTGDVPFKREYINGEYVITNEEESEAAKCCDGNMGWATKLIDILPHEICDEFGVRQENGDYIFYRYKNLMMNYYWLINTFLPECKFYRKCVKGYIEINDNSDIFISEDLKFGKSLSDVDSGDTFGTEYCINTKYYDYFRKWFVNVSTANNFILFMKELLSDTPNIYLKYREPYIDLPFELTQDEYSMGELTSASCGEWVANEKYYIGDIVYYGGIPYKLKMCDKYELFEIDGRFISGISSTNYVIVENESDLPTQFELGLNPPYNPINYALKKTGSDGIVRWYLVYPYYTGYYDDVMMMTLFSYYDWNDMSMSIDVYWMNVLSTPEKLDTTYNASGVTSSKLTDINRSIKSFNDSGELLPFIVNGSLNGDMLYTIGKNNIRRIGNITYSDILEEISFYADINDSIPIITFNIDGTVVNPTMIPTNTKIIQFKYITNARLDDLGTYIIGTGIKYDEKYEYSIEKFETDVDKARGTYKYVSVKRNKPLLVANTNEDIKSKTNIPILSAFNIDNSQLASAHFVNTPTFKDDELLGIQDMYQDVDINIERGKSASYERHNILGEIKTFQDLLHYRNDFFALKSQENN